MATNGLVVVTPTSIAYSGTSASINADGSVSFSAVTSLSLNGVFTGNYDNYMVNCRITAGATTANGRFRLRASGTDDTGTNYTFQRLDVEGTNITGARATESQGYLPTPNGSTYPGHVAYFFGPYLAQPTANRFVSANTYLGASIVDYAHTHSVSSSYDGLTYFISSGSAISGLLTVFGFNQ